MILAGDVGGTKTKLALFGVRNGHLVRDRSATLVSRDFPGLCEAIEQFLGPARPALEAAGFGVAGPVYDGRVRATNLPWDVHARDVRELLGIDRVIILNDLEAMAWGIELLEPHEFVTLQEGAPYREGNAAVIAAGTGLGEALLLYNEGKLIPRPCEGGHTDFAPNDPEMDAYLLWLREELPHVSMERVASGMGLKLVYDFFHRPEQTGIRPHHGEAVDIARFVAESAGEGSCEACVRAFSLFLRCYGAEAGNLALKAGATAGLYVGGGIAVKNLDAMKDGRFIAAFRDKGRYHAYLEKIPVRVILNEDAPVLGAALAAARAAGMVP